MADIPIETKFKVGDLPVFAGLSQRYINAKIRPGNLGDLAGDILPPDLQERWEELVRGLLTQDVATSALGVALEFDSRDNFFSPHRGYKYEFEQLWYRDAFGSDIEYELTPEGAQLLEAVEKMARCAAFRHPERRNGRFAAAVCDTRHPAARHPGFAIPGQCRGRRRGRSDLAVELPLVRQCIRRIRLGREQDR